MNFILKIIFLVAALHIASCTIAGETFMDDIIQNFKRTQAKVFNRGEDPCNPLYWYPRGIPDYCHSNNGSMIPDKKIPTLPMPIPIPVPMSPSYPMPYPMPPPMPFPMMPGMPAMPPPMIPAMPAPMVPLPYGIPIIPSNPMLPVPAQPYPFPPLPYPAEPVYPRPPMGMVPGIPGLVSPDGGLNILPFTDVYTELVEKEKQKAINRRVEKYLDKYARNYRRRRGGYRSNLYE